MTGAAFGTVDVLRDTKMMVSQVNTTITSLYNTFCNNLQSLLY